MASEMQSPGSNSLFRTSVSDLVIASGRKFDPKANERYLERFHYLQSTGTIRSQFEEDVWSAHSNIKGTSVDFRFNADGYDNHAKKRVELTAEDAKKALKLYAIAITGEYILDSIASCDFQNN